ncbi:cell division protein ZapC domain-containing protein, partial [Enterobacter cloacae complex sp.6722794]|uniref:cell division protein ZapC domain-containing protein n=1 Tax=Enterobacter cloacae complex sp.6722794 TaxID=3397173 RepID=UPI003AF73240
YTGAMSSAASDVYKRQVAYRFLKPQMPKSWYFSSFHFMSTPVRGQLIQVCLENSHIYSTFIIAEAGESASLCLLAEPSLELSLIHISEPTR